jgi:hypothetical protein
MWFTQSLPGYICHFLFHLPLQSFITLFRLLGFIIGTDSADDGLMKVTSQILGFLHRALSNNYEIQTNKMVFPKLIFWFLIFWCLLHVSNPRVHIQEDGCINSCDMVRYDTVRCGKVRYGAVRYGTVRCGTVRYGVVWCGAVRYGTVRYGAVRCGTVRCVVRCGTVRYGKS